MKICKDCKNELPLSCFSTSGKNYTGRVRYKSRCKSCNSKYSRIGRNYETTRNSQLKANYGITLETYKIMERTQGGVCAICGKLNSNGRALSVDHDHSTGDVRQLLCNPCNVALGNIRDNPIIARKMAEYLERHTI